MTKKYQPTCLTADSFSTVLMFLAFCFFFFGYSTVLLGQSKKSKSTNKEVVQKWFDMVNNHDISEMKQVFAADYIWHTMDDKDIHSSQDSSHMVFLRTFLNANPNIHYQIVSIISEGDMVSVNTILTGNAQSLSGEKFIKVKQMFFYRMSRGLITEEWEALDTDLLKKQMGRICPD